MSAEPKAELGKLRTEQVDEKFHLLDIMSIGELLKAMNESDGDVPRAIALQLPSIERAIDAIVDRLMQGGRLVYIGAGTSGRLGVLDAAECGPTFSISDVQVIAFSKDDLYKNRFLFNKVDGLKLNALDNYPHAAKVLSNILNVFLTNVAMYSFAAFCISVVISKIYFTHSSLLAIARSGLRFNAKSLT
jgi:hypothetical protein